MITAKFDKRLFFDRKAVADIVGKDAAKSLGRAGAFVQRRARSSLRRRRKTSNAGQPPSVHSQDSYATLKNIQFQFVPQTMSVFVGPVKLNLGGSSAWTPVPGLHEHGGAQRIQEWRFNEADLAKKWKGWAKYKSTAKFSNEWRRRDLRWREASRKRRKNTLSDLGVETRVRTANYPARPFMGPALEKELPKLPSLFGRSA